MENWKDIVWYEWLYQVSDLWAVRSLDRIIYNSNWKRLFYKWRALSQQVWSHWYRTIVLSRCSRQFTRTVHRLLMDAFVPNIHNYPEINHIDCNKQNNNICNLEWCSKSQNLLHAYKTWKHTAPALWKFWKNNPKSKAVTQRDLKWGIVKERYSIKDIQRELWYSSSVISDCCRNIRPTSHGYKRNFN